MATIYDLKISITEMTDAEARSLISEIRERRRRYTPPVKKGKAKSAKVSSRKKNPIDKAELQEALELMDDIDPEKLALFLKERKK